MTAGNRTNLIAVATSIPPSLTRRDNGEVLPDYQDLCVHSWIASGFRVLSINDSEEIPALALRYPDVTFVATTRNASQWTGRKNPYIADLLSALNQADEPVLGIINSDLLFEPSAAWTENLPKIVGQRMVMSHRYEAKSLTGGALKQYPGLDCFFFDKAVVRSALEETAPYAMGIPWWDFWLPFVAMLSERDILMVERPAILHLAHKAAYSEELWRKFASFFVASVTRRFETASHPHPLVSDVMPLIRDMGASTLPPREFKRVTMPLGYKFIPAIRKGCVRWTEPDGKPTAAKAEFPRFADIFERLEERVAAGDTLKRARNLCADGKWSDISPSMIAVLENIPDDADILAVLGEVAFSRGDFEKASALISRSLELAPEAIDPRQTFANMLWRCGEREEALTNYLQILEFEPRHQGAHGAAARLMWELGRRAEALAFLKQAMAQNPDFLRLAELYESYSRSNSPIGSKARRILGRVKSFFTIR